MSSSDLPRSPLWAKRPERLDEGATPYPVDAHLLDTTVCAMAVWDHYLTARLRRFIAAALADGDEDCARAWVALAAGLHDCGKATYSFQVRPWQKGGGVPWTTAIRERLEEAGFPPPEGCASDNLRQAAAGDPVTRHEVLGMGLLSGESASRFTGLRTSESWLPIVVGGHHGIWHRTLAPGDALRTVLLDVSSGRWGEEQRRLIDLVSDFCGVRPGDAPGTPRP